MGPESLEEYCGVNYTGDGDESLSDLDWRDVGNYGTDSEVDKFLQNNEETQGYEELQNQTDVDVYKIFAKEQIVRGGKGKNREILANCARNWPGHLMGEIIFGKCKQT